MKQTLAVGVALTVLCACSPSQSADPVDTQAGGLFDALMARCGEAFEGRVLGDDPRDADWREERLVAHVRTCSPDEIRVPLHVGEDRSRTWVLTRQDGRLQLKHDHRHEDGSEDVLTQYGGLSAPVGDALRVEFPADPYSRDLFVHNAIPASAANVWFLEIEDGALTYGLDREGRHFRAVFDLTQPVETPPAPWGASD
jgi:hypothetical protein